MTLKNALIYTASGLVLFGCAGPRDQLAPRSGVPAAGLKSTAADAGAFAPAAVAASELQRFEIPAAVAPLITRNFPELQVQSSTKFKVSDVVVGADLKTSTLDFSGTLNVSPGSPEPIKLQCHFDPTATPWTCDDMYPLDPKLAAEKRVQGTATCDQLIYKHNEYICDNWAVKLFVLVDGRIETQLFQSKPFELREATRGDAEDAPISVETRTPEAPSPLIEEITPSPAPTRLKRGASLRPHSDPIDRRLSDAEAQSALSDPDRVVEFNAPVATPAPKVSAYSIAGIETVASRKAGLVPVQAVGSHDDGRLRDGAALPMVGTGFRYRYADGRNFGTNFTIETLMRTASDLDQKFPHRPPLIIANIASKGGGHLCSAAGHCHASHQTGLDVDVVFPSKKVVADMWEPCRTERATHAVRRKSGRVGQETSTICARGAVISGDLDTERLWTMLNEFTCGERDEKNPVIAMFTDQRVKNHLCAFAKARGERLNDPTSCAFRTLRAIKHQTGHYNHVHVRFRCPGNIQCRDTLVSLPDSTGCP